MSLMIDSSLQAIARAFDTTRSTSRPETRPALQQICVSVEQARLGKA
jgi:hypothetical protein